MKRQNKLLFLVIVFIVSCGYTAHSQVQKYYLDVWGALGYANLIHEKIGEGSENLVQPLGGVGGLFGLGFEYHYKRFMMNIGVEADFKNSTHKFKPFIAQVGTIVDGNGNPIQFEDIDKLPPGNTPSVKAGTGMIDSDGDHFAMRYEFQSYRDVYNIGYVNVPLMLGSKFRNGMYFLAGGKFGINIFGYAKTKAQYSTYGLYPQYVNPIQDTGNHLYDDFKTGTNNPISLNFNVAATLEIGKIFFFYKKKTRWHYRISGFADYGIGSFFGMSPIPSGGKNVLTNVVSNGSFLGVPGVNIADKNHTDVSVIKSNSILTSSQFVDKGLFPLLVGVKVRLLFDLGNKEPCNCLEDYPSKWRKMNKIK